MDQPETESPAARSGSGYLTGAAILVALNGLLSALRTRTPARAASYTTGGVDDGKLRWCWLELGGAAIMLQESWKCGHHTNVPTDKLGVGVSICFMCKDAVALYHEFKSRGVDARRPFVGNRLWVTQTV